MDFPRVLSCTDRASGASFIGSTAPVAAVTLNGTAYEVRLHAAPADWGAALLHCGG